MAGAKTGTSLLVLAKLGKICIGSARKLVFNGMNVESR
jgi:hypothetical protein